MTNVLPLSIKSIDLRNFKQNKPQKISLTQPEWRKNEFQTI